MLKSTIPFYKSPVLVIHHIPLDRDHFTEQAIQNRMNYFLNEQFLFFEPIFPPKLPLNYA